VTVLAAGGTIAMTGPGGAARGVTPELTPEALVASAPALGRVAGLRARSVATVPSAHLTGAQALEIARAAVAEAASGRGVVVTHGTDVLEEVAFLAELLHDPADAPVVFTGAMRPASAPGADGPANLLDAVTAAETLDWPGVLVAFAGELHTAREVTKADSTGPAPFRSPRTGPVGHVGEGRARVLRDPRPAPRPALAVAHMDARVHVVSTGVGTDGDLVHAAAGIADGLVVAALGAGHLSPPFLAAVREVAARMPVVATVRPARGAILHGTYGFAGAEGDLRASGAVCAAGLSPQAARIALMACLGAGADVAGELAGDDL
jgi:L-asparaginase